MLAEAELAFKQAWALSPGFPETTMRFAAFLQANDRTNEALRIVRVASKLNPKSEEVRNLLTQLLEAKKKPSAQPQTP